MTLTRTQRESVSHCPLREEFARNGSEEKKMWWSKKGLFRLEFYGGRRPSLFVVTNCSQEDPIGQGSSPFFHF